MGQYDEFAENYIQMRNEGFNLNKHIEMPAMFGLVGDIRDKKLLDLGCGFGEHAKFYSEKGAKVTGVDSSVKEITHARSQNIENAEFIVHDINKGLLFEDDSFDIITSSLALDHLKSLERTFKECFRVLKDRGIMIFSIANPIIHQEGRIAGKLKEKDGTKIYGDYFTRRKITHKWRQEMEVSYYHRTLGDYFSAFLNNGFNLIGFEEPRPIPSSREFNEINYEFTSRNPYFFFFTLRKK